MGSEIDDTDTTKFNPLLNIQKMESTIDKKKTTLRNSCGKPNKLKFK